MRDISMFVGESEITISQAMKRIDDNSRGILFLTNQNGALSASITDGDIRRYLLLGGKLDDKATEAANLLPKSAESKEEAKIILRENKITAVPIVNKGKIIRIYFDNDVLERTFAELNIPVVINAGGKGTRLDPFTRVLPKPLIPVGDYPIVEHIMKEYCSYSCDSFHIIVNYKKELMKAYFADNENQYDITWYDEDKPLGTGGGLSMLKGKVKGTFFFANCDVLLTADYADILKFHRDNHNLITMVCAYKNLTIPYGVVNIGKNGRILDMREKPSLSFLTNTGMYVVEPEVLDDIPYNTIIGFPDIVENERAKGAKVAAYPISENDWMDMGQLSGLEEMNKRFIGE